MKVELAAIPRESVAVMWPVVEPGIEEMLEKGIGILSKQQVYDNAVAGEQLLFVLVADDSLVPMATIICHVCIGERRVFEVSMTWGRDMNIWFDTAYDGLLKVAIELKCEIVAVTGRRGWIRQLRSRGFSEKMVTLIKELPT